jgi:hypothetical protein
LRPHKFKEYIVYKGSLIFLFGGIFGSIFGALVGGALGFFGGAIFKEVIKDDAQTEEIKKRIEREQAMDRVNYRGMSRKPMSPEETDEFVDRVVSKIQDFLSETKTPEVPTPEI